MENCFSNDLICINAQPHWKTKRWPIFGSSYSRFSASIAAWYGTQNAKAKSALAVLTVVMDWPALTTGMGPLGLTARRSLTPVPRDLSLTSKDFLQRLRVFAGSSAKDGVLGLRGNVSQVKSSLTQQSARVGLNGGIKMVYCQDAFCAILDGKNLLVITFPFSFFLLMFF